MIKEKINKLRKLNRLNNIDGYIVPKNDDYFSEYALPNRLKTISNFSGSAGFAIILKNQNYLFVDGRYILQAKIESGKYFKIIEIPKIFPYTILKKFKKKLNIGFDPRIFTNITLHRYFNCACNLVAISNNLIDEVHIEKKDKKSAHFYILNHKITGNKILSKINELSRTLKKKKIDNIFISAPENVAWLLNIRGKDNPNSPIPNCRAIVTKDKRIFLFTDFSKIKKIKKLSIYNKIYFKKFNEFFYTINQLKGKNFCIDKLTCSVYYQSLINSKFYIKSYNDPCYNFKSIKNINEIKYMKKAHIDDGVALTKFLFWLKNTKKNNLSELSVEKKLEKFRKRNKNYLYPSFNTIAGSGPNGAIIHYRANKKTNRKILSKDLLLCDSGGQYKFGTTDVTRTVCFKNQNRRVKDIFTRVLKGHIAVATTDFNKINKGYLIDQKARYWLNKINLDYSHGTGHGVGFFLNVHEGPQAISKYNNCILKKGMILSNEPGYYEKNKFGIRIENLVYIDEQKNNLFFKNLTFAPIDTDLINFNLLNNKEKKYLSQYHLETYLKISRYLNKDEKNWLQKLI